MFIEQLLSDTSISSLVDEFYFEHHVAFLPMQTWWGNKVNGTLADSYDIFLRLRQLGVRAHAWI